MMQGVLTDTSEDKISHLMSLEMWCASGNDIDHTTRLESVRGSAQLRGLILIFANSRCKWFKHESKADTALFSCVAAGAFVEAGKVPERLVRTIAGDGVILLAVLRE